jgi:hypothetical protein
MKKNKGLLVVVVLVVITVAYFMFSGKKTTTTPVVEGGTGTPPKADSTDGTAVNENEPSDTLPSWGDDYQAKTGFDFSNVPSDFDWRAYVAKYPDLQEAGIDTELEAKRHYSLHGKTEGRTWK